jgi:release factor glutamine methyltransferase
MRECALERNDAIALACHTLHVSRAWIVAHDDQKVPTAQLETLTERAHMRRTGVPMAYVIGEKEFYGRKFTCSPAALVPRPETELLVERVLAVGDAMQPAQMRVLDVGTGTGCIAVTIACERRHWQVDALDVSLDALKLARENILRHSEANHMRLLHSSWFEGVRDVQYDIIVSNPPYIHRQDIHLNGDGVRHEPRVALTDEADGLTAYRIFAKEAHQYLRRNGVLLMEHGYDQADAIAALFAAHAHWDGLITHRDLAGHARVTEVVYRPAAISA